MSIKCTICKRSDAVTLADEKLCIYRCGACDHTFKDLPPQKQERYEEAYFSDAHKNWFSHPDYKLYRYIHKKTRELLGGRKISVIDVGCGKGGFLKYLAKTDPAMDLCGIDLTTIDPAEFSFIQGDIMKDKIDGRYDVVTSLAVIEHVDDPGALVRKMGGLLSPGGIMFVMTDDDSSMIYSMARALKKLGMRSAHDQLYELHHLQCFTRASLNKLMEENGFEVVAHTNHNYPVAGVDMPKAGFLMELCYKAAVRVIFSLSTLFGNGILQTVVCRKRA